jgi:hypothetical protein
MGRLRTWAGLGVLALLGIHPVWAQEPVPPPRAESPAMPPAPGNFQGPTATPLESTESHVGGPSGLAPLAPAQITQEHKVDGHMEGHGETHWEAHEEGHEGHGEAHGEGEHEEEAAGCAAGLFATGEYLLVRPRRNALDFAVSAPNVTVAPSGEVQSLNWETRSSFRAGFGYQLPEEPWQVGAYYTYVHSSQNRSLVAPDGGTLFATLTRGGGVDDVLKADGSTSLDFNVIDVEAARLICVGPHLDLKVFGGGRFAWIDQKLTAVYNGGSAGAINDTVSSPVYFNGGGLSAGAQGFWKIYQGLGLYGRIRTSLLTGQFRNFLTETNNNGAVTVVDVRERYRQVVPVTELGMGVGYQGDHLFFSVGYELQNWYNMVNSLDFPSGSNIGKVGRRSSDLSLEALSVQLGLLF